MTRCRFVFATTTFSACCPRRKVAWGRHGVFSKDGGVRPEDVDWTELARKLGAFDTPGFEHSGSTMARAAVEELLGPEVLRSAVDHYVARKPGAELARHILWLLHPLAAMERCHQIYVESTEVEERRSAVELLRVVAD